MSQPLILSEARARLRRIADRMDAIALLYPRLDNEPVSEAELRIQDDDLAIFLLINKAQFLIKGDARAQLITGLDDGGMPGSN